MIFIMVNGDTLRRLIRHLVEVEVLLGADPVEEDDIEEMSSCGSVGAMGYQLPLGADPEQYKNKEKRDK